ncbi:tetratricopeptide repeat protein [Halovulum sp. GXIMD14794]
MTTFAPTAVSDDSVRKELERILGSSDFQASERNRRFLQFVVDETLSGRADRIKAYTIATGVFGRSDDFDPQQDSIVRIEAARLRRAIELFYLVEGERDGVRLSIPKGAYVPVFERTESKSPAPPPLTDTAPPHSLQELGPRLLVENFDQEGDLDGISKIGRTMTRQVVAALTRFTELFVYGFETADALAGPDGDRAPLVHVDYRLMGTVNVSGELLRVDLLMKKAEDGRFVWTQSFERKLPEPERVISLCTEIAGDIARVLALRDGILDSQAREAVGNEPAQLTGYQKLLDFQDYWRSLDPLLFEPLRKDLEATIEGDPNFAAAYPCLSLMYSNAARYGYDVPGLDVHPLDRAFELARRAIHLAPSSSRAYHARAVAEWFSGYPDESLKTLQIARALNPNDPELLAEFGFRYAMRMNWESAVAMLEEAYIRNPLQTGQYRMGLVLYHFAHGRYEDALRECRAIDAPRIPYVPMMAAAALNELGRHTEARERLDEAHKLAPSLRTKLAQDLVFRQIHPDLIGAVTHAIARIDPRWGASLRAG